MIFNAANLIDFEKKQLFFSRCVFFKFKYLKTKNI